MSYRADKVKFMDGQTDRQTDTGNNNTPSAWKAKGKTNINYQEFFKKANKI